MSREQFHAHIQELEGKMYAMSEMVKSAIERSSNAFKTANVSDVEKIIADDASINAMRWSIEEYSVNLIATQQPVATNLREIIAILNIVTDLERLADHAKENVKVLLIESKFPILEHLSDLSNITKTIVEMLTNAVNAFLNKDVNASNEIISRGYCLNHLSEKVINQVVSNPTKITVTHAMYLIQIVHHLERMVGHITNICERVEYLVTGNIHEEQ